MIRKPRKVPDIESKEYVLIVGTPFRKAVFYFFSIILFFLLWNLVGSLFGIFSTSLFKGARLLGFLILPVLIGGFLFLLKRNFIFIGEFITVCAGFFISISFLTLLLSFINEDIYSFRVKQKALIGNYIMVSGEGGYGGTIKAFYDKRKPPEDILISFGDTYIVSKGSEPWTLYLVEKWQAEDEDFGIGAENEFYGITELDHPETCIFPEYAYTEKYSPLIPNTSFKPESFSEEIVLGFKYSLELLLMHIVDGILFALFCFTEIGKKQLGY